MLFKVLKRHHLVELSQPVWVPLPSSEDPQLENGLKEMAASVLAMAEAQAEEIVAKARNMAETIRADARAEGWNAGREEALQETQSEVAAFLEALSAGLGAPLAAARRISAWLEYKELEVAVGIARKMTERVLRSVLAEHPEWWAAVLDPILEELSDRPLAVEMAPDCSEQLGRIAAALEAAGHSVQLGIDQALTAGETRVSTASGVELMAGIAVALDQMADEVLYGS